MTNDMTKEDIIEILDRYDSDFRLETDEVIQAIYFQDFGGLADELVKAINQHTLSFIEKAVMDVNTEFAYVDTPTTNYLIRQTGVEILSRVKQATFDKANK